ncbi:MmcQ/YjbR family DNA-binding protein [Jiangella aurantiaca]|uniref:MmcQ/YjbR family DNA-binding protein n=1 Tax=Jiangella aurantiaca TaxID=2530373 RepID=A0A4R5AH06_9ACTN|nr:MmcQ/YjbR family DNA-binding protein [Jiangella aurantiaca]TDD70690.1 MmcQ/YjbR family DNA-binding protein [Jiangella aurantiaca]
MVTMEDVRESALRFPEAEESTHFGMAAFKVDGRTFVGPERDERTLGVAVALRTAVGLIAEEPDMFEEIWRPGPQPSFVGVRVALADIDRDRLDELVEAAWRHKAPKQTVAAYDETR